MENKCKYFGICGGCDCLNMNYQKQLQMKTNTVKELFKKNNIFIKIDNAVGMQNPYEYRNKVHLAFSDYKGGLKIGFFKRNSKEVVNIENCPMHQIWLKDLVDLLRKFIKDFKIPIYNIKTRKGVLRYAVARSVGDSIILTLVVANTRFAGKDILYKMLKEKFKFVSLYVNINTRTDSAVFSDKFVFVKGEKGLQVNFMDVNFTLSPNSFMQVNLQIAEQIYKKAISTVMGTKVDTILDLFSGIGVTSLIFAKNKAKVISIESEKSSVLDAIRLQKQNNLQDNITALCGKCEDLIARVCANLKGKSTSIFLDPPRSGAMPNVLNAILKSKPKQIVYLSCNCETLVRDLKILLKASQYEIEFVTPFDMFPHTNHIEVLCSLKFVEKQSGKPLIKNKQKNNRKQINFNN